MNIQENRVRSLEAEIARLESVNDQLVTELQYVDELLKLAGFDSGLQMVKLAASELIEERL